MINLKIVFYILFVFNFQLLAQSDSIKTKALKTFTLPDSAIRLDTAITNPISHKIEEKPNTKTLNNIDTFNIPLFSYKKHPISENNFDINSINIINYINFWTFLRIFLLIIIGIFFNKVFDFVKKKNKYKISFHLLFVFITIIKALMWLSIGYLILYQLFNKTTEFILIFIFLFLIFVGTSLLGILKNLAGGFFLSIKVPFNVGDYISINSNTGIVKNIEWLNTKVTTESGSEITIPNSLFIRFPVTNINLGEKEKQIIMEFSFPSGYKIEQIQNIIYEAALSSPYTYIKKEPEVFLTKCNFIDNITEFKLLVYTIDSIFENELRSSINLFVNNAIKSYTI
ncbi:MAG: mechanosensitive ion channel domain-containing protein [bacterium]